MRPPAWPESKSGRICGCWRCAVTRISLRNRSTPSTPASSGFSTLSATWRSCFRSRATKTVAIPPAPASRSMAYCSASAVVSRSNASDIGHEDRARRGTRPDCLPPVRDRLERVRLPGTCRGGGELLLGPHVQRAHWVVSASLERGAEHDAGEEQPPEPCAHGQRVGGLGEEQALCGGRHRTGPPSAPIEQRTEADETASPDWPQGLPDSPAYTAGWWEASR